MKFCGGNVFYKNKFQDIDFELDNEKFKSFGYFAGDDCINIKGKYIIPGLTDIHTHGAMNADACDGKIESINTFAKYMMENGITQFVPTTMTFSENILSGIFACLGAYDNSYANLVGIHMEGPFIAEDKIGAQNPKYVSSANVEMTKRLDNLSGGLLKIISMAPERDGALEFAKELAADYIISIAHTSCDYDTAIDAFDNGFSQLTHMFNAMNGIHHRAPGPILAAYERAKYMELITDGVHIHPAIVRMVFDLMGDRIILVSDSMRATGLADGLYDLGGQNVEVKGNTARLVDKGNIAGSVTNLFKCMQTAIAMGVDRVKAVKAASVNPARALGLTDMGEIKEGYFANFLILDEDFNLEAVYIRGKERWKR